MACSAAGVAVAFRVAALIEAWKHVAAEWWSPSTLQHPNLFVVHHDVQALHEEEFLMDAAVIVTLASEDRDARKVGVQRLDVGDGVVVGLDEDVMLSGSVGSDASAWSIRQVPEARRGEAARLFDVGRLQGDAAILEQRQKLDFDNAVELFLVAVGG